MNTFTRSFEEIRPVLETFIDPNVVESGWEDLDCGGYPVEGFVWTLAGTRDKPIPRSLINKIEAALPDERTGGQGPERIRVAFYKAIRRSGVDEAQ